MSVHRSRRRFGTAATAFAVAVAVGPFVAPAASAAAGTFTLLDVTLVGPNAGALGRTEQGVNGSTAVAVIAVDSADVLSKITFDVAPKPGGGEVSTNRDFETSDGFALFKDQATAGSVGSFDLADYTAGPVSNGWSQDFANSPTGKTRVIVNPASTATGGTTYFLTVHPRKVNGANRNFALEFAAGAVDLAPGDDLPGEAAATQTITIDSVAPSKPIHTGTNVNWSSNQENSGMTPDSVTWLNNIAEASEPTKAFAYFNDANNTATSNLLITNPNDPQSYAIHSVNTLVHSIGVGTGRTATVTRALNNQTSDGFTVRAVDQIGNLSDPETFSPTDATRNNDVTGPAFTTYTTQVKSGAIHAGNKATVDVQGDATGVVEASGSGIGGQRARLSRLDPSTGEVLFSSPYVDAADATSPFNTLLDASDSTNFPELSRVRGEAALYDGRGNLTDFVFTPVVTKDTVRPTITKIGLVLDANVNSVPDPGDQIKIFFSEPMDKTKILDTDGRVTCDPFVPTQSPDSGLANCVNKRLIATGPDAKRALFGSDPDFDWAADGMSAIITVGKTYAEEPIVGENCGPVAPGSCWIMIANGHIVTAYTEADISNSVTDVSQNTVNGAAVMANIGLVPGIIKTNDGNAPHDLSRFGQGRDGILDEVTIAFNGALLGTSVEASRESFRIILNGEEVTPTHAQFPASNTVRLFFQPPAGSETRWMTGARPLVELRTDSTNCTSGSSCTGVKSGAPGNVDVAPFSLPASDGAAPALISVTTGDDDHDGHLEKMVARYSEPIDHSIENRCGYRTADAAYIPPAPTPGDCATNTATPTDGVSDTTTIALVEKAAFDTDALPQVSFNATLQPTIPALSGNRTQGIKDAAGNGPLNNWSTSVVELPRDGAQPVTIARTTRDRDADGKIDSIDVKFSETISSSTIGDGQFQVTEPTHAVTGMGAADATTVIVFIDETAPVGTGDTDQKPKIRYLSGLTDAPLSGSANPAFPDAAAVAAADGAGPAIISASFNYSGAADDPGAPTTPAGGTSPDDGKKMKVVFSEPIADIDAPGLTKIEATQTVNSVTNTQKPTAQGPTTPVDTKARLLTFATGGTPVPPVYDLFTTGAIRILEANVVKDTATGTPNGNTQVSPAPFFGYPSVKLSLTGPAGSKPDFSTSYTFNTDVTGNDAVVAWRLIVQDTTAPAPTTPAANDPLWSTTQPTSYTVPALERIDNTTYKGYLYGKDAAGNVTHKDGPTGALAEDTIRVILPPVISNVKVQNIQTLTDVVRDGDNVRVTADAASGDVAEWSTDGSCMRDSNGDGTADTKHMRVDYRSVTSRSTDAAVIPFSCQLLPGTPAKRAMEFPYVKAAGTTRYPVGAVLRTSNVNDPGWLLEDGANGVVRRMFVSVNARRSWGIPDSETLVVSASLINSIPVNAVKQSYRQGMPIRRQGSSQLYVVDRGRKRPVTGSYARHWRYTSSNITTISVTEFNKIPYGPTLYGTYHPLGTYVRDAATGKVYVIVAAPSGQPYIRPILSPSALTSWVPWSQVVTAIPKDLTLPVDPWSRGYRDGVMLKDGAGKYYVVSRGLARRFASDTVFNTMGYKAGHARPYSAASLGREGSNQPESGVVIDFRTIGMTITVENQAGAITTAGVNMRALGTESAPPALPNTRPALP